MTRRIPLALATAAWLIAASTSAQTSSAPVDLLHAVATDLAVSSAYRSEGAQVGRLVDGDTTTAWNSRTGDLVGAWIEVRLPADAQVTAIALVPGFARPGGTTDLFTGNHRVSRIQVLREGTEVGTFAVATGAAELVTIPVTGAGGVWRIVISEVLPGSRSDWREACISELQILGRAPSVAPGTRLPRTAVGALPAVAAPAAVDAVALERTQRRDVAWLVGVWREHDSEIFDWWENTGEPTPDTETVREIERRRAGILRRIVTLTEGVDPAAADAVRLAGSHAFAGPAWRWHDTTLADLAAVGHALDVVATRIGSDEARCRSARAQAEIRLTRVAALTRLASYFDEIEESMGEGGSASRSRALEHESETLETLRAGWTGNARGIATRLLARSAPTDERAAADWAALVAQLQVAREACGWDASAR
jgi:hypothetical protein